MSSLYVDDMDSPYDDDIVRCLACGHGSGVHTFDITGDPFWTGCSECDCADPKWPPYQ